MKEEYIREIFELNADFLGIPDAIWHEDKQCYTVLSKKQFAWNIFIKAFKLGLVYAPDISNPPVKHAEQRETSVEDYLNYKYKTACKHFWVHKGPSRNSNYYVCSKCGTEGEF